MSNPPRKYPTWICGDCGRLYGRRTPGIATYHINNCDVCGRLLFVTEPRDFGHLKPGWQDHPRDAAEGAA